MSYLMVYVWSPSGNNVGHTSMLLPDGTYISWWPRDECSASNPSSPAAPNTTLEQDIHFENDANPHSYKIKCSGDQFEKIKKWWNEFKSSKENNYNLLKSNCSTVVYMALKLAFPELECFNKDMIVWLPAPIRLIAGYLSSGESNISKNVCAVVEAAEKEARQIAESHGVKGKKIKQAGKYL